MEQTAQRETKMNLSVYRGLNLRCLSTRMVFFTKCLGYNLNEHFAGSFIIFICFKIVNRPIKVSDKGSKESQCIAFITASRFCMIKRDEPLKQQEK